MLKSRDWGRGGGSRDVCTLPCFCCFAYTENRGEKRASSMVSACCRRLCRVFYSFFVYMCVRLCKKKKCQGDGIELVASEAKSDYGNAAVLSVLSLLSLGEACGETGTSTRTALCTTSVFCFSLSDLLSRVCWVFGDNEEGKKTCCGVSACYTPSHTRVKREVKPCK